MKYGFTLSEVLITLGIIGVVSALTLPALIANIQQEVLKNRWKKAYNNINQAYQIVQAKEDLSSSYDCGSNYCFQTILNKILNEYKDKGKTVDKTNIKYKTILGKDFIAHPTLHVAKSKNDLVIYTWTYHPGYGSIWVDVNGYKKPNVLGKDLFALEIRKNRIYPYGQFMKGDFCKGIGSDLGVNPSAVQDGGNDKANFAGIGCSYKYLYEK